MVGNLPVAVGYIMFYYCSNSRSLRNLLSDFRITNVDREGLDCQMLFDVLIDVLMLVGGEFLLIASFQQSLRAEINQGVVSSMFVLSSTLTAIISWSLEKAKRRVLPMEDGHTNFFQRAQCNRYHILSGVLVLICFFLLINFPKGESQADATLSCVIFVILTSLYFSVKDMLFKNRILKYALSPNKLYSLIILLSGVFMILTCVILILVHGPCLVMFDSF